MSQSIPPPRRFSAWLALAFIAIPVFVGSIDLTIVSAFLPEIVVNLELPIESVIDDAAWIVTGYLLAYTISLMFMGRLSDIIGRRRAYVACLVIFMIGSFVVAEVDPSGRSGISNILYNLAFRVTGSRPDPGIIALITIIIGRVIQAFGAGALVPISLALVADLFPANKRAQPLGAIGAIDTLGWVLGHLYGGVMVRWFSDNRQGFVDFFASLNITLPPPDWRTLFWINLPVSMIALVLTLWALRHVPQTRSRTRFDLLGALLASGALLCLVLGLGANIEVAASATITSASGLPPYALPLLALAVGLFSAFIVVELRIRDPLFDLRALRQRSIAAGLTTNLVIGFCLMLGLVVVPFLVNVRVADPSRLAEAAFQVGVLLSALTIPMALAAIPGGWLSERIGASRTTILGLIVALAGFVLIWQTWTLEIADSIIALEMILVGVGLGLTFSPISASVINAYDQDKLGVASALVILMRLLGMTISVSLLTSLASQRLATLVTGTLGATVDPRAAVEIYARLTVQVLTEVALVGAILCALALIPAWWLGRGRVAG